MFLMPTLYFLLTTTKEFGFQRKKLLKSCHFNKARGNCKWDFRPPPAYLFNYVIFFIIFMICFTKFTISLKIFIIQRIWRCHVIQNCKPYTHNTLNIQLTLKVFSKRGNNEKKFKPSQPYNSSYLPFSVVVDRRINDF